MKKNYPEYHTPEALANQMAEVYKEFPDALVVGSLGRAGIYRTHQGNANVEFSARNEHPLYLAHPYYPGITARDIDFIGVSHDFGARTLPFWVDATSYYNDSARIEPDGTGWVVTSKEGFSETLHPDVMAPERVETIYGVTCLTLPAETQLALLKARGELRPKDVLPYEMLRDSIDGRGRRLSHELFHAFEKLHNLNRRAA